MIILASASPRRRSLLKKIIDDFKIIPSNIEENIPNNININEVSEYLSTKKALSVLEKFPEDTVIGADTIIVFKNKIFGKPKDKDDAREMLQQLSGNTHQVITGVCIASKERTISFSSINKVKFYELSDKEIDEYLSIDEYKDKAGSYAIQSKGGLFIKSIDGDYNSIIGLPIAKLNRVLKSFFNI